MNVYAILHERSDVNKTEDEAVEPKLLRKFTTNFVFVSLCLCFSYVHGLYILGF